MIRLSQVALILTSVVAGSVQGQSITFQNATPPTAIELQPGSSVTLDSNGSLVANCNTSTQAGCARLTQGGGGQCGTGVTFTSQLSVTNPPNPPAPGPYPGGSSITVAAQATGAVVCIPRAQIVGGSAVSMTGWTNAITPSGSGAISQALTLPSTNNVQYQLTLQCYGSTGSAESSLVVRTSEQIVPPPPTCTGFPAPPFTNSAPGQAAGVAMSGYTTSLILGYETLQTLLGIQLTPFAPTNGYGIVDGPPERVRFIEFTVPADLQTGPASRFVWAEFPNNFDPPKEGYFTVSQCPGDFRFPSAGQAGTANDPTFADGCRNWRAFQGSGFLDLAEIKYSVSPTGVSTADTCVLRPGQKYYFNIIMNRPSPNRTMPPLPSPPNTLCGSAPTCGIRAAAFL